MEEIKLTQVGIMSGGKWDKMNDCARRVYDENGLAPTITTMGGGNLQPKIMEIGIVEPSVLTKERTDGTVGTLTTDGSSPKHNNRVIEPSFRIRKLTPRECWRLMGFSDEDFDRAKAVNSDSQLYKQAGNSIVCTVLEEIFRRLL